MEIENKTILIISEKNDIVAKIIAHCFSLTNYDFHISTLFVDADTNTSNYDPKQYDIILQIGIAPSIFSKDIRLAKHNNCILLPLSRDIDFRWRQCEELTRLQNEAKNANLLLALTYTDLLFLENFNTLPVRLMKFKTADVVENNISNKTGSDKKKSVALFISAESETSLVNEILQHSYENIDFNIININYISQDLEILNYDYIILPPISSRNVIAVYIASVLQKYGAKVLGAESFIAFEYLLDTKTYFLSYKQDFISNTVDYLYSEVMQNTKEKLTENLSVKLHIDVENLIDIFSLFINRKKELNAFLSYSSSSRNHDGFDSSKPYAIFHYPNSIIATKIEGRPIRLNNMISVLSEKYNLIEVHGNIINKRRRLNTIKDLIAAGIKFDFCYSETCTSPFSSSNGESFENIFFKFLNRIGVPIVAFIRDVYWHDANFIKSLDRDVFEMLNNRGDYDFKLLSQVSTLICSPSDEFYENYLKKYNFRDHLALPPACNDEFYDTTVNNSNLLKLLYTGGLSTTYNFSLLLNSITALDPNLVHLTILARENEINTFLKNNEHLKEHESISFQTGELRSFVKSSSFDLGVLLMNNSSYMKNAMPNKFMTYIGIGLPIIADDNGVYSNIISKEGLGYVVKPTKRSIKKLLIELSQNKELLKEKKVNCFNYYKNNKWSNRVEKVQEYINNLPNSMVVIHHKPQSCEKNYKFKILKIRRLLSKVLKIIRR